MDFPLGGTLETYRSNMFIDFYYGVTVFSGRNSRLHPPALILLPKAPMRKYPCAETLLTKPQVKT